MSILELKNAGAMTELLIPAGVLTYSTAQEDANHVAPDLNLGGAVHKSALIKSGLFLALHCRVPSAVHLVNSAEFLRATVATAVRLGGVGRFCSCLLAPPQLYRKQK